MSNFKLNTVLILSFFYLLLFVAHVVQGSSGVEFSEQEISTLVRSDRAPQNRVVIKKGEIFSKPDNLYFRRLQLETQGVYRARLNVRTRGKPSWTYLCESEDGVFEESNFCAARWLEVLIWTPLHYPAHESFSRYPIVRPNKQLRAEWDTTDRGAPLNCYMVELEAYNNQEIDADSVRLSYLPPQGDCRVGAGTYSGSGSFWSELDGTPILVMLDEHQSVEDIALKFLKMPKGEAEHGYKNSKNIAAASDDRVLHKNDVEKSTAECESLRVKLAEQGMEVDSSGWILLALEECEGAGPAEEMIDPAPAKEPISQMLVLSVERLISNILEERVSSFQEGGGCAKVAAVFNPATPDRIELKGEVESDQTRQDLVNSRLFDGFEVKDSMTVEDCMLNIGRLEIAIDGNNPISLPKPAVLEKMKQLPIDPDCKKLMAVIEGFDAFSEFRESVRKEYRGVWVQSNQGVLGACRWGGSVWVADFSPRTSDSYLFVTLKEE